MACVSEHNTFVLGLCCLLLLFSVYVCPWLTLSSPVTLTTVVPRKHPNAAVIFLLSSKLIPSFLLDASTRMSNGCLKPLKGYFGSCHSSASNGFSSHAKHKSVKWSDLHPQLITSLSSSLTALPPARLISLVFFKRGRQAPL